VNPLSITTPYAAALGLLSILLSLRVVLGRGRHEVSLGDGGYDDLIVAQRAHGNFVEYVPLALLLIALNEFSGQPAWVIHALGAGLLVSRVLHPLGLATSFSIRPARAGGYALTLVVTLVASVLLLWTSFAG
jgi:uncharacterized membrane protein YecN with MAPEG domain